MLDQDQVDLKILSVKDFRQACLRNNFYVPAGNSQLCNRQFLQEVRLGTTFVPKIDCLKFTICSRPPTLQLIQAALVECLENGIPNALQVNKPPLVSLLEHLKKRAGDKEWMLKVLGHLSDRNHPFFAKDYVPPKKQNPETFTY